MNVSKTLIAALALFWLSGQAVFGQWTTSGNNIYNANSGNVGIGTATPGLTLDVAGPIRSQSGAIDLRVQAGWAGAAALGTISNSPLLLVSNGLERMRVGTNGDIGIGTTSPIGTLHVSSGAYNGGAANASADDLIVENGTQAGISVLTPNNTIGQLVFGDTEIKMAGIVRYDHSDNSLFLGTNGANRLHINNIGNVGIGTASPVQLHHVHQTTGTSAGTSYSNGTTGAALTDGLYVGYDDQGYVWNYENAGLQFATNNAPRMTITAGGDVSVGTATPSLTGAQRTLAVVAGASGHSRAGLVLDGSRTDAGSFASVEFLHHGTKLVQLSGYRDGADDAAGFRVFTTPSGSGWSERLRITSAGNVGIGTTTPAVPLEVHGGTENVGLELNSTDSYSLIRFKDDTSVNGIAIGALGNHALFFTAGTAKMRITNTGNVGIGTATPTHKLTVNGTIRTEEVEVVPDVPADFVFEDDYTLPSLEDVERHIDEHGHLPEIPSAAAMKADGVGLSTMQMKLLQKIEELTLYLIEQNKVLADVQEENTHLKQRLIALEAAGN